jgi:hypothetical protein
MARHGAFTARPRAPRIATFDLAARDWHKQLGDMRARRMKELRLDIKPPFPGLEP